MAKSHRFSLLFWILNLQRSKILPSTVKIELFYLHSQQLTSAHNRHDGKDSDSKTAFRNNSYRPYLFNADQCVLSIFGILSKWLKHCLCWRILAFSKTRESVGKVHSFNFFDILKWLKLMNTKMRMERQVWKWEIITSLVKKNFPHSILLAF